MLQNVHVNQKIRKLLAIGKRFAVVLLPYVDNKYKNLGQFSNRNFIHKNKITKLFPWT